MSGSTRILTTQVRQNSQWVDKQVKSMEGVPRRFQMQYLSVMFFGMAIQRTFMQIEKSAVQTYLKITEGQTQAGQALLGLSAAFTFLSFTVGEAIGTSLMPFLPLIIDIITKVGDWVSQNQELVGGLITFGLVFGSVLFLIGFFKLGVMGVIGLVTDLIVAYGALSTFMTVTLIPAISKLAMTIYIEFWWLYTRLVNIWLPGIATSLWSTALLGAAAAILLYLAWENNLFGIKDITAGVTTAIVSSLFQVAKGFINLIWLIAKAQETIESFFGSVSKPTSDLVKQLADMSAWWQGLIEYSYSPAGQTRLIQTKPLTELIQQSVGEIQTAMTQTNTTMNTTNSTINTDIDKSMTNLDNSVSNLNNTVSNLTQQDLSKTQNTTNDITHSITIENINISSTNPQLGKSDISDAVDSAIQKVMDDMKRYGNYTR